MRKRQWLTDGMCFHGMCGRWGVDSCDVCVFINVCDGDSYAPDLELSAPNENIGLYCFW